MGGIGYSCENPNFSSLLDRLTQILDGVAAQGTRDSALAGEGPLKSHMGFNAAGEFPFPGAGLQLHRRSFSFKIVGRFRQTSPRRCLQWLMLDPKLSTPLTWLDDLTDQREQALGHAEAAVLQIESNFGSHHTMFPK